MFNLFDIKVFSSEQIAQILNTSPEALKEFENAYNKCIFDNNSIPDNLFEINAKQMANHKADIIVYDEKTAAIVNKIVKELIVQTQVYTYSNKKTVIEDYTHLLKDNSHLVDKKEIMDIPESIRPQLSGNLMQTDTKGSGNMLVSVFYEYMNTEDNKKKKHLYDSFRQGLDILDLDNLTYAMIDKNPNSMGYWLPRITNAVDAFDFFKIPDTKIIKVPVTLLQLTRMEYESLTRTTLDIVDNYCYEVFGLDENKDYFIKTGTYSSKFDFRNAHVMGAKEVHELGEYLLFIHWQALQMAHFDLTGRKQPVIYGVSTTTEWVVREFIKDVENNPTIYNGLPLHTEYRVFVDFDSDIVLGIHNYWDPEVMLNNFSKKAKNGNPEGIHDYITYLSNKDHLVERYEMNKNTVIKNVQDFIPLVDMHGQWSIDIMQNGDDFYLIDMAVAENSTYYVQSVPAELRKPIQENWLPDLVNNT